MPDVAKAAKVGVGTVYRHFPTKDDLIAALAAERFERLAEKVRKAIASEDPWEGVCEFIRWICARDESHALAVEPIANALRFRRRYALHSRI